MISRCLCLRPPLTSHKKKTTQAISRLFCFTSVLFLNCFVQVRACVCLCVSVLVCVTSLPPFKLCSRYPASRIAGDHDCLPIFFCRFPFFGLYPTALSSASPPAQVPLSRVRADQCLLGGATLISRASVCPRPPPLSRRLPSACDVLIFFFFFGCSVLFRSRASFRPFPTAPAYAPFGQTCACLLACAPQCFLCPIAPSPLLSFFSLPLLPGSVASVLAQSVSLCFLFCSLSVLSILSVFVLFFYRRLLAPIASRCHVLVLSLSVFAVASRCFTWLVSSRAFCLQKHRTSTLPHPPLPSFTVRHPRSYTPAYGLPPPVTVL